MKRIIIILIPFFPIIIVAQQSKIDSLRPIIKTAKEDTYKVNRLNGLSWAYINIGSYETSLHYSNSALQLASKLNFKNGSAYAYNNIGIAYYYQANYPKTLENWLNALKLYEELKDKRGTVIALSNMGNFYLNQIDFQKALDYYFRSLKINEELGNKDGIALQLGQIGNAYEQQGDYAKALEYNLKALRLSQELGNKNRIANWLANIGNLYADQAKDVTIHSRIRDSLLIMAQEYNFRGLKLFEEIGAKNFIVVALGNIGSVYTKQKKYTEAEQYLLKSLSMAKEIGSLDDIKEGHNNLRELFIEKGDYKNAYEHFKQYSITKDSIFNTESSEKIANTQFKYEQEKKDKIRELEEKVKEQQHEAEVKQQKIVTWSVVGGLLLVITFAGFIFRALRVTRKQKHIIEEQKQLVEEHQKDIIDSITYAKRLQEAILPPLDFVKKHLPDSFILYKPKDIVAGDFYWMHLTPNPSPAGEGNAVSGGEVIFIAACDCTGHGVPGAMVSVVCSNALNRTVKEFGLRDTGKILDKVTELVVETFEKSDKDVKDGMDISLLAIQFPSPSERDGRVRLQWSGANNPLLYIQNNELIDITADKQPIGKHDNRKPFSSHAITLQTNATFYLFTDGFADQFGGPKGKKFKYKQFEEKLLVISAQPMEEQKKSLEQAFDNWKGSVEQVDDVLVIGIKI